MPLTTIREGAWRVLAVTNDRGDCPLLSFLAELEGPLAKDGTRMLALLERMSKHGPPRDTEVSHRLVDGLWQLSQGRMRLIWFFDRDRVLVMSHGFVKKGRTTPALELARGRRHRQQYFRERALELASHRRAFR